MINYVSVERLKQRQRQSWICGTECNTWLISLSAPSQVVSNTSWMLICCRRTAVDMCPVHGTYHIVEAGWRFWWILNKFSDRIVGSREADIFLIKCTRWQYIKDFAKVSIQVHLRNILNKIYWIANFEIVSFEHWNLSATCWMDGPVTHIYRKIATCSLSDTSFPSSRWQVTCDSWTKVRNTWTCTPSSVQMLHAIVMTNN